jgi:hypothetical protein
VRTEFIKVTNNIISLPNEGLALIGDILTIIKRRVNHMPEVFITFYKVNLPSIETKCEVAIRSKPVHYAVACANGGITIHLDLAALKHILLAAANLSQIKSNLRKADGVGATKTMSSA